MEIIWSVSGRERLVRMKYIGKPDFGVWQETMLKIFSHRDYRPGFGFVADLNESDPPDTAHVHHVEAFFRHYQEQMTGGRWANVTSAKVHYGMSRMAQALSHDLPSQLEIFSDVAEAERWARGGD